MDDGRLDSSPAFQISAIAPLFGGPLGGGACRPRRAYGRAERLALTQHSRREPGRGVEAAAGPARSAVDFRRRRIVYEHLGDSRLSAHFLKPLDG